MTADRLRLSVFRSNKHLYAQIIDDKKGVTVLGVSEKLLSGAKGAKVELAKKMGTILAEQASKKKITHVVFDRGRFAYHGRIKALAESAREGGLKF